MLIHLKLLVVKNQIFVNGHLNLVMVVLVHVNNIHVQVKIQVVHVHH